jgi:hypothetical protein
MKRQHILAALTLGTASLALSACYAPGYQPGYQNGYGYSQQPDYAPSYQSGYVQPYYQQAPVYDRGTTVVVVPGHEHERYDNNERRPDQHGGPPPRDMRGSDARQQGDHGYGNQQAVQRAPQQQHSAPAQQRSAPAQQQQRPPKQDIPHGGAPGSEKYPHPQAGPQQ